MPKNMGRYVFELGRQAEAMENPDDHDVYQKELQYAT